VRSWSARAVAARALPFAAVIALLSCGDLPGQSALDRASDTYIKLVAALGQRDPDSLDYYAGPDDWLDQARRTYASLADIRDAGQHLIAGLQQPYYAARKEARRTFLLGQLTALVARVDILNGSRFDFDEESRQLFGAQAGTHPSEDFAGVRQKLDALLPGTGSLSQRYATLDGRFIVPSSRVPEVFTRAIAECRRRTLEHLELPADERVDVEYVRDMPWPAFTRYRGANRSTTQINQDFALTIDRLLDVACHETYPGHHAIDVLLDQAAQPMYSPLTFRTEGAASYAVELAFPDSSRLPFERELCRLAGVPDADLERYLMVARLVDRLRWLQVDVARQYLDGHLEFVRAARVLQDEALLPEASAEAMLKFFNRFRTYSVTYTAGFDAVERAVGTSDEPSRWRAFQRWIGP
jgi:hypothetical protein